MKKKKTIGLIAGRFAPGHRAHFSILEQLAKSSDRLIVFIGHKIRNGVVITAEQSQRILEVYSKHINKPVTFVLSKTTPVKELYDWVDTHQTEYDKIYVGATKSDTNKYQYFERHSNQYKKVEVKQFDLITENNSKFSATNIRNNPEYLKTTNWTPNCLTEKERKEILLIII